MEQIDLEEEIEAAGAEATVLQTLLAEKEWLEYY